MLHLVRSNEQVLARPRYRGNNKRTGKGGELGVNDLRLDSRATIETTKLGTTVGIDGWGALCEAGG
jgi:hypothetical protein